MVPTLTQITKSITLPSNYFRIHFIITLSSTPRYIYFLQVFRSKLFMHFSVPATCLTHLILNLIILNILIITDKGYKLRCYLLHDFLKHPVIYSSSIQYTPQHPSPTPLHILQSMSFSLKGQIKFHIHLICALSLKTGKSQVLKNEIFFFTPITSNILIPCTNS